VRFFPEGTVTKNERLAAIRREMLDLSDEEGQYLKGVEQGRGLLISEGQHYAFHNRLTKPEEALFTTKPTEVAY